MNRISNFYENFKKDSMKQSPTMLSLSNGLYATGKKTAGNPLCRVFHKSLTQKDLDYLWDVYFFGVVDGIIAENPGYDTRNSEDILREFTKGVGKEDSDDYPETYPESYPEDLNGFYGEQI